MNWVYDDPSLDAGMLFQHQHDSWRGLFVDIHGQVVNLGTPCAMCMPFWTQYLSLSISVRLLHLAGKDPLLFFWLEPPREQLVKPAFKHLQYLQAVEVQNRQEVLTEFGELVVQLQASHTCMAAVRL